MEPYLLLNQSRLQRRSSAKLRLGTLPLEIETGRYSRPVTPLDQRVCKMCDMNVVESELHFLVQCPLYIDQRITLFNKARHINQNFDTLNENEKMLFMMNEEILQGCLTKTVKVCFVDD